MLAAMRPGSVAVDLAVESDGNLEGVVADEVVDIEGVKIVSHTNVQPYSRHSVSALCA